MWRYHEITAGNARGFELAGHRLDEDHQKLWRFTKWGRRPAGDKPLGMISINLNRGITSGFPMTPISRCATVFFSEPLGNVFDTHPAVPWT